MSTLYEKNKKSLHSQFLRYLQRLSKSSKFEKYLFLYKLFKYGDLISIFLEHPVWNNWCEMCENKAPIFILAQGQFTQKTREGV